MVTVLVARGLRFVIFTDDHDPAHVHVFGDGQLKINLIGVDGPTLIWADGMKRTDIRRAMAIVVEHRDSFLARWKNLHG